MFDLLNSDDHFVPSDVAMVSERSCMDLMSNWVVCKFMQVVV